MTNRLRKFLTRSFTLLAATALLAGCSASDQGFPAIADPPPFDYADGDELRSRMHQLAFELQQLDLALASRSDDSPNLQQDVRSSLNDIERIGGLLQSGDLASKHPFLQDDMDRFLDDVRRAQSDAESSQPRYYMAGRISGSCMNCHRSVR